MLFVLTVTFYAMSFSCTSSAVEGNGKLLQTINGKLLQTIFGIDNDQELFCKLGFSTIYALTFASVASLLAISVDRYLYFVKPMKYPMIVTCRPGFFPLCQEPRWRLVAFSLSYINALQKRWQRT